MKTALAAEELRLRPTVSSVDEAAFTTSLGGMSWINSDNLAPKGFGFVFKKSLKPRKAPRMESTFGLSMRCLTPSPDVREVFDNNCRSWLNAFEDRSGYNVVTIPPEAFFTSSEASKVPLGGLRTVGLEPTFEEEIPFTNFRHMSVAMKAIIGGNGWASNAKINTDSLTARGKLDIRQLNNDMKEEFPFAIDKVGSCRRTIHRIPIILWKREGYLYSTACCGHTDNTLIPVDLEGMQVISGRAKGRLRAGHLAALLPKSIYGLQGLGCLAYCLNMQVRDKIGESSLRGAIGKSVQFKRIGLSLVPASLTNTVKGFGKMLHRFMQGTCLFQRRPQYHTERSVHEYIIPYNGMNLQVRKGAIRNFSAA